MKLYIYSHNSIYLIKVQVHSLCSGLFLPLFLLIVVVFITAAAMIVIVVRIFVFPYSTKLMQ